MTVINLKSEYTKPVVAITAGAVAGAAAKPIYNFVKTNFHAGLKEGASVDTFVKRGATKVSGWMTSLKNTSFMKGITKYTGKTIDFIKKPFVKLANNATVKKMVAPIAKFLSKPVVKGGLIGAGIAAIAYFGTKYVMDKINNK